MENDHQLNLKESSGPGLHPTTSSIKKDCKSRSIHTKLEAENSLKVPMIKFAF